jgi:hypothetical protein
MNNAPGKEEQAFEGVIHQQPDILQCRNVSGKDSYMSRIRPDSLATLRRLPARFRKLSAVERTITFISFSRSRKLAADH